MTGASFTAQTGQVDFSIPGNPSTAMASQLLGSIARVVKRAACDG